MGTCCNHRLEHLETLEYSSKINLLIQERDRAGKVITRSPISFSLPQPSDQHSTLSSILNSKFRLSGCILPGFDPRGECEKDCQDTFSLLTKDNSHLSILFDGHGKDGRRVALFCRDYMLNYFHKYYENFEQDPTTSIEEMVEGCDDALQDSGLECNLSGTTAVIVIINVLGIHTGSVGDSRAVLASLPKSNSFICPEIRKSTVFRRQVMPSRVLDAVQMTVDQKPNHENELKRIRGCGGVVEKLADDFGRPVGPYRVWKKNGNLPGLAMSRSIGDRIAHEIGVISAPICHTFKLYPSFDQFIVIATDGIWDVMDNFEVVNFIEKFRKSTQNSNSDYPALTSNSTIARLLCEEARFRWFGVVEEEDVMIDDISCIIIEIGFGETPDPINKSQIADRKVDKFKSVVIETGNRRNSEAAVRKDPTRGSMATGANVVEEALLSILDEDGK